MKILPLILPLFDAFQGIDYKSLYTKQPLKVVFGDKIPFHPNTENLERENQSWIDRKDEHKDRATRVIKLKNHVPLTPHTAFNLLENTRHCWVIFPYDSEVDEIQPIIDILKDLRVIWKFTSRTLLLGVRFLYPGLKVLLAFHITQKNIFLSTVRGGVSRLGISCQQTNVRSLGYGFSNIVDT